MSNQITSVPPAPPARGFSGTTLLLSVLLAVAVTAAAVLGVLALRGGASPPGPTDPSTPSLSKDGDVYVQRAQLKPEGAMGHVIYPMPYALPPHLTLTAEKRRYTIVKQDELGFTWVATDLDEDFTRTKDKDGPVREKRRDIVYEPFTWEARGVKPQGDGNLTKLFEQEGNFCPVPGEQGDVNFPFPYALPPNVELSGSAKDYVVLMETRATGFKWKHNFKGANTSDLKWKAKGIRATTLPK